MSKTYSIACTQCKKHLWIAQGRGYPKPEILDVYRDKTTLLGLERFLIEHFSHPLVFADNCEGLDGYEDVEGD